MPIVVSTKAARCRDTIVLIVVFCCVKCSLSQAKSSLAISCCTQGDIAVVQKQWNAFWRYDYDSLAIKQIVFGRKILLRY